MASKNRR